MTVEHDGSTTNDVGIPYTTGVAMANATYEFMRANATEEMRRVLGAKAANVQLAVPPTLAAGDWSVDSEGDGEGSSVDLHQIYVRISARLLPPDPIIPSVHKDE